MRTAIAALLLAVVFAPLSARAEVTTAAPGTFVIEAEAEVAASPEQTWRALGRLPRWWNGSHTYSGDASNLSFDARAGGCWCERWRGGQSVEHGRVVLVTEHEGVRTLRILAGLGPLQSMGVNGVLTLHGRTARQWRENHHDLSRLRRSRTSPRSGGAVGRSGDDGTIRPSRTL